VALRAALARSRRRTSRCSSTTLARPPAPSTAATSASSTPRPCTGAAAGRADACTQRLCQDFLRTSEHHPWSITPAVVGRPLICTKALLICTKALFEGGVLWRRVCARAPGLMQAPTVARWVAQVPLLSGLWLTTDECQKCTYGRHPYLKYC